ncbi:OPT oligopeptide transporter protein-domain-containing protein [Suillus paluster]|uniref:OPT oligopeptide transporter protein-domain-containing protein n=1 Tax=Suillus paluster TaxID=48578 RepID=UPI001B86F2E4|nr:OPT oligopeptide transporter protein-domain-containing protein [Suillus paluster]KAG1718510.1 OPT oligopeptide transporter protein-domain-containing protein [Suillus paluster]
MIITCIVMSVQFGQNVGVTLLGVFALREADYMPKLTFTFDRVAIIFSFLFSLISCESVGRTNLIPVGATGSMLVANASQLIFGGLASSQNYPVKRSQLLTLLSGMLTLGKFNQSFKHDKLLEHPGHMIQDLKTAHLLRASPRAVFVAQLCGAVVSIFVSAGLYVVFSTAYPCINDLDHTTCPFSTPSVQAWRAVAVAVTSKTLPIPPSSGYTAIALGFTAAISVVAKYTVVPPRYHPFMPNFNAIGIGMMMNVSVYPLAMSLGSTLAFFWRTKFFNSYQTYCFAIAAGFIAGEGVGSTVNAVFTILGVSGATYGSSAGCPGGIYCG